MAEDKKLTAVREAFTKAQLLSAIAEDTGLTKKDVGAVLESLGNQIERHLKPRGVGTFTLPGLLKLSVTKKPATKERKGVNPFTGEAMTIAAKPARRAVKARILKGLKELAE
jgi:nucleoid DNA-binding protein